MKYNTDPQKTEFMSGFIINCLYYLLDKEIWECLKEFSRLNNEALTFIDCNNSSSMQRNFESMKMIVNDLIPLKEYILRHHDKKVMTEVFDIENKVLNKKLFEDYRIIFLNFTQENLPVS